MQEQESQKATPAPSPDAGPLPPRIVGHNVVIPGADHSRERYVSWPRPSELELATLAARLARTEKMDPQQLVREAWSLYWECCRKIEEDQREVTKILEEIENEERWRDEVDTLPAPSRFPVPFEEMERLLLPKLKGRTAERARVLREFVFAEMVDGTLGIVDGKLRPVTYWEFEPEVWETIRRKYQNVVAEKFGDYRKRAYDQREYVRFARRFLAWQSRWKKMNKGQVKAANALKGWKKRRKLRKAKTGARPKLKALKEVLDPPPPGA